MAMTHDTAPDDTERTAEPRVDLGELPDLLGYTIRRAQIAIYEDFARVLGPLKLRPAEFSALVLIDRNPGLRQRDLGDALGIQPPNIVGMMSRMETGALIERRPHPFDSRSVALSLTPAGATLLQQARTLVRRQDRAMASALSDADYRRLIDLLRAIPAGPPPHAMEIHDGPAHNPRFAAGARHRRRRDAPGS